MSYRTYINRNEWLGNNEGPQIILDELKRQGCEFNEDWCTIKRVYSEDGDYEIEHFQFEIKDLDALVKVTEQAIINMVERNKEIADFNSSVEHWKHNLTYMMGELRQNAYIFWSSRLLDFVGKENYTIEWERLPEGGIREVYKLKPGVKCLFEAY